MNTVKTVLTRGDDKLIEQTHDANLPGGAIPKSVVMADVRTQAAAGDELLWLDSRLEAATGRQDCYPVLRASVAAAMRNPLEPMPAPRLTFKSNDHLRAARAFLIETAAAAKAEKLSYASRILQAWIGGLQDYMAKHGDAFPEFDQPEARKRRQQRWFAAEKAELERARKARDRG